MINPIRQEGYELLQDGAVALAQVEANGIRIDIPLLESTKVRMQKQIRILQAELQQDKVWNMWRRSYGSKASLASRQQLSDILFQKLGFKPSSQTESGKDSTDGEALQKIEHPFVQKLSRFYRYEKALGTFLKGIEKEIAPDGRLHPSFNLHMARSFRSSANDPNFQNFPVRDKEISEIIRSMFRAKSSKYVLVENDFKGIEVALSASYHKDPNFISYITTPGKDMHRDMAAQIYKLKPKQVSKDARYGAKNKFVFPQFYGDYYLSCAQSLWEWIEKGALKGPKGDSLFEHLKRKGITGLGACDPDQSPEDGTFEAHLQDVENDFWNNRFQVYGKWKRSWYELYVEKGYFDLLTGFRVTGFYNRKQVCNYPIQGCLQGDSRVLTSKGLIPIKNLVGRSIKVWTGFKWAEAFGLDRGSCQKALIQLDSGLVIHCDIRHKLKNELGDWVEFPDLKKGMLVSLPKIKDTLPCSTEINWWFVFGFILGDGCISSVERRKLEITVGKTKKKDLERIYQFLILQGYRSIHWRRIPKNRWKLTLQDRSFSKFLVNVGFQFGWTAHTKKIPSTVWTATPQQRRDFLEGLWRSDGSRVKWQERNLGMCNKELLQEVQLLCSAEGFDTKLQQIPTGWLLRTCWRQKNAKPVRKYPIQAIKRFVKKVSSKNYSKRNEYITDSRSFLSGKPISQYVAERILQRNGSKDAQCYRFDHIKKITILPGEETTFTMSVDDPLHQFVADGVIHKNSAFHCLLWSLIRINKILQKHHFRSMIVGQIHDSLIGDVRITELRDYLEIVEQVTTVDLPKRYPWLVVSPEIEYEIAPPGKSWFHKREVAFKNGVFTHPTDPKKHTNDPIQFTNALKNL